MFRMPQITRQLCNLGKKKKKKKDILKYYIKYFWFSIKILLFIKNISNFQEKNKLITVNRCLFYTGYTKFIPRFPTLGLYL